MRRAAWDSEGTAEMSFDLLQQQLSGSEGTLLLSGSAAAENHESAVVARPSVEEEKKRGRPAGEVHVSLLGFPVAILKGSEIGSAVAVPCMSLGCSDGWLDRS